jgi:hypothetical protein
VVYTVQAKSFGEVLDGMDLGKKVPDLLGLGYSMLGLNDSLTFTSIAWNITLDPISGTAAASCPEFGRCLAACEQNP